MRSTLPLRAGGIAGALSVAVVTTGSAEAQAQTGAPPVSLKVSDPRIVFGDSTVVTGVTSPSAAGRRVQLEFRADGASSPWRPVAGQSVRLNGRFRIRGRVEGSGAVRVRLLPDGLTSGVRRVRVRPRLLVSSRRLQITAGTRARVRGHVRPGMARLPVSLQMHVRGRWRTLDAGQTGRGGTFALSDRRRATMSARVRVKVSGRAANLGSTSRGLGRLEVYRHANASWYGPGLYGNHLGCGGRLSTGSLGVAHKTLPCGTLVTFRRSGRTIRVPVIDRGPFVGGREYDLTSATAQRLGFRGHGPILATR